MGDHFNQLTPEEDERLALLAEECAEVIQVIAKIQRHGYESRSPMASDTTSNRQLLEREVGDVMAALDLMCNMGDRDLSTSAIEDARRAKHAKLPRWMHHQPTPSTGGQPS